MTTSRRSVMVAICLALSLGAAACGSDENSTSPSDTLSPPATTTTVLPIATSATTTIVVATTTTTPTVAPPPTAAPTTTVAPTTTTVPPGASLPLRSDGIGDASFGAEPDEVVAYVSGVIGDPADDSGWVDAISRACPGTEVRSVRWDDLTLWFGDESSVASGRRHYFAWSFGPAVDVEPSPAGLATPEGISIGSSVVDIGRAYPTASLSEGDEQTTPSAQIGPDLRAFVTDTRDFGVITAMLGGQACGAVGVR